MPALTAADTIRILVATDNHVGYNERDPIRGDDSWKSFDEVMCLARENDVDMVLLAGDLFHENKPSRKSMYQVMRSLRMNCYGEKPCELEMLSDGTEAFQGAFNHVNYEDPDINVAIPVFSIHGNHDDPSGEGHLAALDLLSISGLVNYYGRTPESDNILVKPILLQKGRTKLALYGMSNVRDERLFRTFRDGKVKFFQPSTQKDNWFNLMSVHQNHHAYTEKGYLPENFLPDFLDLVVWGHEHECLIDPRFNPEMNFHVMQPGSSVATSLMPGEAVTKHIAILSITGKEFRSTNIRLKSVRPFVMKEIVLQEERNMKELAMKENNRTEITRHLMAIVESLINEAKEEWLVAQGDGEIGNDQIPLPLVRLRVEYTAPEGGKFDCENPQRFSNRFVGKVANVNDVIQFHRKKTSATRKLRDAPEMPEDSVLAEITLDSVKVEKLVREFLTAQSLTILPQNSFGDAVSQFVDKDDKHAMELFVEESLKNQVKHLLDVDDADEDDLAQMMDDNRSKLEELFAAGHLRSHQKRKLKPKPSEWDSDLDGHWVDQPGARAVSEGEDGVDEDDEDAESVVPRASIARGRGKATGTTRGAKTATTKATGPKSKPATAKSTKAAAAKSNTVNGRTSRARRKSPDEEEEEDVAEDSDLIMVDDEDDDGDDMPAPARKTGKPATRAKAAASTKSKATTRAKPTTTSAGRQTQLSFSQPASQRQQTASQTSRPGSTRRVVQEVQSDDEISDDDDAFEPPAAATRSRQRR